MDPTAADTPSIRLNDCIAQYERVQERDGQADLTDFLPPEGHPLYQAVLCELVRLDLEYGWQRGRPLTLDTYQARFPELFADSVSREELAFEEYRLRCQAGEQPSPHEYQLRYGVNTLGWPVPTAVVAPAGQEEGRGAEPPPLCPSRQAQGALPEVGGEFLGFRLLAELGRGAFGRVYLAEQADLGGRLVALKVTAGIFGEPQVLAQLQHSHIVPIYSLHRRPPFQAVCMPYFGPTSLADILRDLRGRSCLPSSGRELVTSLDSRKNKGSGVGAQGAADKKSTRPSCLLTSEPWARSPASKLPRVLLAGLTYTEAVLWIGARLADGMGHAHERGILHLDLKPANVLISDEGQPMLLDFNLSWDTKGHPLPASATGGTLPYMAPEQLKAFTGQPAALDGRCDLYALGIILFELLTGKHPFTLPPCTTAEAVPFMLQERLRPPPSLRRLNPAVTPAVEAIIRHCLEPQPQRRYQSARDLQEDLERQLLSRPLRHAPDRSPRERARKWLRRHPRLASAATILVFSAVLLFLLLSALSSRGKRLEVLEAGEQYRQFQQEARQVQFHFLNNRTGEKAALEDACERCRRLLGRYRILDDPAWQQAETVRALGAGERRQLAEEVGELLLLWARVNVLCAEGKPALEEALALNRRAEACFPESAVPRVVWRQRADLLAQLGREDEARELLARRSREPRIARELALTAAESAARGRYAEALEQLGEATRRDPRSFWAWFDRGLCHEQLGQHAEAAACYGTCIALEPGFAPLFFKRGLAYARLGKHREAAADFDQVVRLQPDLLEACVNRALARTALGQHRAALADLTDALDRGAAYTRIYFIRATVRARLGDVEGAARDHGEGLRRRPTDEQSWLARGVARVARDPRGALADFEAALALNPRSLDALRNQAYVLSEKLGRRAEAVKVLDRLVQLYPDFVRGRGDRGVLLARLGQRPQALADAAGCLKRSDEPFTHYQAASIYALTSRQDRGDCPLALKHLSNALRRGCGADLLDSDPDLDPLRNDPDFRRLAAGLPRAR
jgi:serine/threonine protein kinase/Flp pilus assembly protein TadD